MQYNQTSTGPRFTLLSISIDCTIQNLRLWAGYLTYNKKTFPDDILGNENWNEELIESSNTKKWKPISFESFVQNVKSVQTLLLIINI